MESSPQSAVPPPQIPASKGGCACCAMGCTTMFVVALLALALLLGGSWWLLTKVVNDYTSSEPISVEVGPVSDEQFATANQKFEAVHEAVRRDQSITVEFTAAQLNALIARHPEFREMRGKFRVGIADSVVTLEMSVPLREIQLPKIRDRWLNASARFELIYHNEAFNFSLRSLTTNDREVPLNFLRGFEGGFNKSFNEGFEKAKRADARSNEFWDSVKTLAVIDDRLVITTKGAEVPETTEDGNVAEPEDEVEPSPTASPVSIL